MTARLAERVAEQVEKATALYHRLVILAGPSRSGKTSALRELHAERGWPIVNLNLALSEKLLELTTRQRALRVARIVDDILVERDATTVLLDNTEMLFHPALKQEPIVLFRSLSRNRTVVATWRGTQMGSSLIYGAPDHPEYRRVDDPQALIVVSAHAASVGCAPLPAQEHPA